MMKLGSFSVSLNVANLEASRDFYQKLGFEVLMGEPSMNWLILKKEDVVLGLFQGMLSANGLTFNPGWDSNAQPLAGATDVRQIQQELKRQGISFIREADESGAGPDWFMIADPDGNQILFDQHL